MFPIRYRCPKRRGSQQSRKNHSNPISLTHSFPYVAAQIDKQQSVGIDLEQPKEKDKTQPSKPTTDAKVQANKIAEQKKKILEDNRIAVQKENERFNREEENRQNKQIQTDKTAALRYLQTAFAYLGGEDFEKAKAALWNAKNINTLSSAAKKAIQTAVAYSGAEDEEKAKRAIEEAKKIINAN